TIDMTTGTATFTKGPVATVRFDGLEARDKLVEVWLPHNETTELVALRSDEDVHAAPHDRRTWVHHGSSISHGSNAASPSTTWPALAATSAGVDLVNLGFGGSAVLDPFVARTIRDLPADLISLKLGINLVNLDVMRRRAFGPAVHGFLDTIRDGHPTTPLLVIGPILCPIHEQTPGPAQMDMSSIAEGRLSFVATGDPDDSTRLTLTTIRADLERVVGQRRETDPHLAYLDGRELYGEADAVDLPLPDQLHPDAETHRLIGERFAEHPLLR
ncbi:MAG: SGNH/GDSL hydrolase family protein, partial [Nocardioides sp.]